MLRLYIDEDAMDDALAKALRIHGVDVLTVGLIVMFPAGTEAPREFKDVVEFLDSLTPVQRTLEEWAQAERELQEERNSWDF